VGLNILKFVIIWQLATLRHFVCVFFKFIHSELSIYMRWVISVNYNACVGGWLAESACTFVYSDMQRCMLTAANITGRDNYILFVGDSRVREQFHELVDIVIGARRTYKRSDSFQSIAVQRLRLRAVRFCVSIIARTQTVSWSMSFLADRTG